MGSQVLVVSLLEGCSLWEELNGNGFVHPQAAPINAVLLWSVPPALRPMALSVAEVLNHALGDVPLPPLLGLMQQRSGNWRVTMSIAAAVLGGSAVLFAAALCLARRQGGAAPEEAALLPDGLEDGSNAAEHGGSDLAQPLLGAEQL